MAALPDMCARLRALGPMESRAARSRPGSMTTLRMRRLILRDSEYIIDR